MNFEIFEQASKEMGKAVSKEWVVQYKDEGWRESIVGRIEILIFM